MSELIGGRRLWASLGLSLGLASAVAQAGSGPAPAAPAADKGAKAPAEGRRCFRPDDVNGWRPGDQRTVYVRAGVNRVFRMELMIPCPDINWSERIGIEARGSPWICSGLDATIISPSSIGPRRCPVTSIQELSPAELAALPARQRP